MTYLQTLPPLAWITIATVAGGILSVVGAAIAAMSVHPRRVSLLIAYAVGALLGAAFLGTLPHALREAPSIEYLTRVVLGAILGFFVLEKLVLWRHCHVEDCEVHDGHETPSRPAPGGQLIIVGDAIHNFVDGVLIATAFLADTRVGLVTALAIVAHEIPQEIGNFLILLHSGYSKMRALVFNLLSSCTMIVGGIVGYMALQSMQQWIAPMLGIAAGSMIYVAVADLIPGLHQRPEIGSAIAQIALISFGVATIFFVTTWLEHP
jgi:zinc and cadmium transporter